MSTKPFPWRAFLYNEEGYREVVSGQEERVNYSTILRAVPVVVLEWCERRFDSVCWNMFGLAHRVLILSYRTAHLGALAHLAATVPCKLDSREGYRQWWRVLLENDKLNPGSMSKDMQVLTRKDLRQLSCFDNCWYWSVLAESIVFLSQNLHKMSYKQ